MSSAADTGARYRAAPPDALRVEPLDGLQAIFDRRSGVTHLVAEPAPELLAGLAGPTTANELMVRLTAEYDLADPDPASLAARLDELLAAGLVERVAG